KPDREIALVLGIARQTVALWQERFVKQGIAGIEKDAPRSGRPPHYTAAADRRDPPHNHSADSSRGYPLEHSHAGASQQGELLHSGADLAGPRSEASPCEDVQAEQ